MSARLQGHPLHSSLRYREFLHGFSRHTGSEIEAFLAKTGDSSAAHVVRRSWLDRLARQRRWERYLEVYSSTSKRGLEARHRCHQARALLETGNDAAGFPASAKLWRVPRSQDKACDRAFAIWAKRGGRTPEELWARLEIALGKGNPGLARYVAGLLEPAERAIARRWIRNYRRPKRIISQADRVRREPSWQRAVEVAVASLARRTPGSAAAAWRKAPGDLPEELDAFASWRIGLGFAQDHRVREAIEWLERVPARHRSPRLLGVLALLHFSEGRWAKCIAALDALPPDERGDLRWRYWKARALSNVGRSDEAGWTELAAKRDYYGFLAADRIDAAYRFEAAPGTPAETLARVARKDGFRRAREFHALGYRHRFTREWNHLLDRLEPEEITAAADLASRHGWHFEAIQAAARAGEYDRLDLRFPLAWKDEAVAAGREFGVDPAWVLATIRMESAFLSDARSSAGALGLMQILPGTGRQTARAAGMRRVSSRTLLDADANIRLGSAYLRRLLDRMQGNPALASASYNAGPHRVERWLAASGGFEPALWVEFVPYRETRQYVKRVLEYRIVYQHRLGTGGGDRLHHLLGPLPG